MFYNLMCVNLTKPAVAKSDKGSACVFAYFPMFLIAASDFGHITESHKRKTPGNSWSGSLPLPLRFVHSHYPQKP